MTLIELLYMCVGKTKKERETFFVEVGVDKDLRKTLHDSFDRKARLVGGTGNLYQIIVRHTT